jgi:hypothetical protein
MPNRKPGNVERKIEADDRRAKVIGAIVDHFVDELRDGAELNPIVAREALEDFQLGWADSCRIIE